MLEDFSNKLSAPIEKSALIPMVVDVKITQADLKNYLLKSNSEIRDTLYSSYDIFLSEKYEIKVFQNTIERLKNNFR